MSRWPKQDRIPWCGRAWDRRARDRRAGRRRARDRRAGRRRARDRRAAPHTPTSSPAFACAALIYQSILKQQSMVSQWTARRSMVLLWTALLSESRCYNGASALPFMRLITRLHALARAFRSNYCYRLAPGYRISYARAFHSQAHFTRTSRTQRSALPNEHFRTSCSLVASSTWGRPLAASSPTPRRSPAGCTRRAPSSSRRRQSKR